MLRSLSFGTRALATVLVATGMLTIGCANEGVADEATGESAVVVAPLVIVADPAATAAAETLADSIRIPLHAGQRYRSMTEGTIFVGARGPQGSKNRDGFLRRVVSVKAATGMLVVTTTPATLTDAIVDGAVRTTGAIDGRQLVGSKNLGSIDLDFGSDPLFANVDEIETPEGTTTFTESVRFEKAQLFARPVVDVEIEIERGKVTRFLSKIEGQLDASIVARAEVTAEGDVTEASLAALREKHHQVSRVIYKSKHIPLPTFSVGGVPVSPAVDIKVTMNCDLTFGGPLLARAGVEAKSYVRLAAIQEAGAWAPPSKSDFDIAPSFAIERGSEVDARCTLVTDAELSAFGTAGVTMSVAPYVDFDVTKSGAALQYSAGAGATGSIRGRADVFGITGVERSLAEWKSKPLTGKIAP